MTITSLILCYLSLRTWEMGLGIMLALEIVCFRKHVYSVYQSNWNVCPECKQLGNLPPLCKNIVGG